MVKTFNLFLKIGLVVIMVALVTKFTSNRIDSYNTNQYKGTPITMEERERQLTCLAKNVYHEAATEPFEGKVAVAQVTLNRVASGKFPPDICDVVYQKNVFYGRVICQFSWYCQSGPRVISNALYKESMEVAKKVLLENFRLPSMHKAMYYHAEYVKPNWNLPKISQIGRHIFYGEKNGKI
jgi:spore germination cell wall hydrolase CwlJ-like protein